MISVLSEMDFGFPGHSLAYVGVGRNWNRNSAVDEVKIVFTMNLEGCIMFKT